MGCGVPFSVGSSAGNLALAWTEYIRHFFHGSFFLPYHTRLSSQFQNRGEDVQCLFPSSSSKNRTIPFNVPDLSSTCIKNDPRCTHGCVGRLSKASRYGQMAASVFAAKFALQH
jgi:hypothetical protein